MPTLALSLISLRSFVQVLSRLTGTALFFPWLVAGPGQLALRLVLAAAASLGIAGAFPAGPGASQPDQLALLCVLEFVIGAVIGFVASLPVAAFLTAGELSALTMGLPPQGQGGIGLDATSSIGSFSALFALLIFLLVGGHRLLLKALARSFELLPASGSLSGAGFGSKLVEVTGNLFLLAFQLAFPVIVTVLIAALTLGLAARSAGQVDTYLSGLPLRALAGLTALFVLLPPLSRALAAATQRLEQWLGMSFGS
jgi:flagellar biosynthesis protein FliR